MAIRLTRPRRLRYDALIMGDIHANLTMGEQFGGHYKIIHFDTRHMLLEERVRFLERQVALTAAMPEILAALAWPERTRNVKLHRPVLMEITAHTDDPEQASQLVEPCIQLAREAGFIIFQNFPLRAGSIIFPFILLTEQPVTQPELEKSLDCTNSQLRNEQARADIDKTKTEALLNRAKAIATLIAALGIAFHLHIGPINPEIKAGEDNVPQIEWSIGDEKTQAPPTHQPSRANPDGSAEQTVKGGRFDI